MADVDLSIVVSRTLLGLGDLQIGYGDTYFVAPGSFGATVVWDRDDVGAPWTDGAVTVNRKRGMVAENLIVEVKGSTLAEVQLATDELIDAMIQDRYTLTIDADDAHYVYDCRSADYAIAWKPERLNSAQGQVTFSMPRSPVLLSSGTAG